jgi:serine/threonine protein kinase
MFSASRQARSSSPYDSSFSLGHRNSRQKRQSICIRFFLQRKYRAQTNTTNETIHIFVRFHDPALEDLLTRMMAFDPDERATAKEVMENHYFDPVRSPLFFDDKQQFDIETTPDAMSSTTT